MARLSLTKKLEEFGFCVVSIKPCIPALNNLRSHIFKISNLLSKTYGYEEINDDQDLINFRLKHQEIQYKAVRFLWNSSPLLSLGSHPYLEKLLKNICQFKEPVHDVQPLLRVDIPIKEQSLFQPHQDYTYNIGSRNSVTLWIPLQNTGEKEGSILVAPKSHKNGVYPNKKGIIDKQYSFEYQHCNVKFGQALIFDQKLVHKSGFNSSNNIRFSIQLRFSDLGCKDYFEKDFPINSELHIKKYLNEIKS